jgi:hypothetical protein
MGIVYPVIKLSIPYSQGSVSVFGDNTFFLIRLTDS